MSFLNLGLKENKNWSFFALVSPDEPLNKSAWQQYILICEISRWFISIYLFIIDLHEMNIDMR